MVKPLLLSERPYKLKTRIFEYFFPGTSTRVPKAGQIILDWGAKPTPNSQALSKIQWRISKINI